MIDGGTGRASRPAFRAGLNYWPADAAMYWWWHFDRRTAQAELERIAAAGFGYLRFFLLWEAFQLEPGSVVESALRDLERFADLAERAGLRLQPTLFTGHMSGANWLPRFATVSVNGSAGRFSTLVGGRPEPLVPANFYADEAIIQAQELLAREAARVLARHPALWSWDLGNEPSNVCRPPTREAGRRWLARMVRALRAGGSEHPVTIGLHMEDLEQDRRLGPREAAEACDYLCMHGYPLYAAWARDDLDATLLPFLGLVTRWLGGKPVLFQEFGLPVRPSSDSLGLGTVSRARETTEEPPLSFAGEGQVRSTRVRVFAEADGEAFYRAALAELRREAFLGGFGWCANDYAEFLWNRPPLAEKEHERFFGLFRADGSPKACLVPWRELQAGTLPQSTLPPRGIAWIDSTPERFWRDPLGELRRLYARFVSL